jgi:hypothetical protein
MIKPIAKCGHAHHFKDIFGNNIRELIKIKRILTYMNNSPT